MNLHDSTNSPSARQPAHGTVRRVDGRDVLRFERRLAHPVGRVWKALTDPAEAARWLTGEIGDLGEPLEVEPEKVLVHRFGPTRTGDGGDEGSRGDVDIVRWELTPDEDGTLLVLTHTFAGPPDTARIAAGWHTLLERLDATLAGDVGPWPAGRWLALHEEYIQIFPEPGVLYKRAGRPRLVFDRWLARPPEEIWAALTDNDRLRHWFPARIEGDLVAGGKIRFVSVHDELPPVEGEVREVDPPNVLSYTFGRDVLRWEIWTFGGHYPYCRLVFTHDVFDEGRPTDVMAGWHLGLDMLGALLVGTPVARSKDRERRLREEYDARYRDVVTREFSGPGRQESTLRLERRIDRPVEHVWAALTEQGLSRQWLDPAEIELEPRVGGAVRIVYHGYDEELHGSVREIEPGHVLAYDWGDDRVRWELAADGQGARLTFTLVTGEPIDLGCAAGWSTHHEQLVALLTSGTTRRPPAAAGRMTSIDGRPAVHFERWLPHPPEKVWAAISEPEHLRQWFPAEVEGPRQADAELRFVFAEDEAPPKTGRVLEYDPPWAFAFTWEDDVLRFEIEPEGDGCRLYFSNSTEGSAEQTRKTVTGWHVCLDVLAAALGGDEPPAPEAWKEVYVHYAREL
ncbi:MAG TPA: SRPBCC domain-containing protein [Actinopolymorphaceae bacterium]